MKAQIIGTYQAVKTEPQNILLEGYVKPNQWAAFTKHYRFMASIYGLA